MNRNKTESKRTYYDDTLEKDMEIYFNRWCKYIDIYEPNSEEIKEFYNREKQNFSPSEELRRYMLKNNIIYKNGELQKEGIIFARNIIQDIRNTNRYS